MAKFEFLTNIRSARDVFHHRVVVDSRTLDPDAIARRLESTVLWLTPSAVKGFDPDDFQEMPAADRDQLAAAVACFTEIASKVPSTEPATTPQIHEGRAAFEEILHLLQHDIGFDRESAEISRIVMHLTFPPGVSPIPICPVAIQF